MPKNTTTNASRRRLQNALWGLFIGDALAMPAHWYYRVANIGKVFDGGIRDYQAPPHPHLESFMVGMTYHPDVATARRLGRAFDILHAHARFYHTSYSALEIRSTEREKAHGNPVPGLAERYHYHHGLEAGENTLAAQLVRVLMRSVIDNGRTAIPILKSTYGGGSKITPGACTPKVAPSYSAMSGLSAPTAASSGPW